MSNHLVFSVFLILVIILCQATPILTPQQHAELQGEKFCERNDKTLLKNICIATAIKENIVGYEKRSLKNLSCKTGDAGKVLLDPGNGEVWELVQDALLECVFYMPADQFIQNPYEISRTFGRGLNKYDVFRYVWNKDRSRYVAVGLYRNWLEGLI